MLVENTTHTEDSNPAAFKRASKSPHRILLVDDDSELRDYHAEILARYGYNVDTAENGVVAWNTLHEVSYDLLITDNNMPKLTGLELIQKVRSEGMKLPIILASGTVPTAELTSNSPLRIEATLLKPFYPDELLTTVKKVLGARESNGKQSISLNELTW